MFFFYFEIYSLGYDKIEGGPIDLVLSFFLNFKVKGNKNISFRNWVVIKYMVSCCLSTHTFIDQFIGNVLFTKYSVLKWSAFIYLSHTSNFFHVLSPFSLS